MYCAIVELPAGLPPYTVHQYLYGYFPQHPRDASRPFVFRQSGNRCLLVSRIRPACPHSEIRLDVGRTYPAEALLVPTHKLRDAEGRLVETPITSNSDRRAWFTALCARSGGSVGFCQWFNRDRVQFRHSNGCLITYQPAQVKAMLVLTDVALFSEMLLRGLGRGKAFGYGLIYLPGVMS